VLYGARRADDEAHRAFDCVRRACHGVRRASVKPVESQSGGKIRSTEPVVRASGSAEPTTMAIERTTIRIARFFVLEPRQAVPVLPIPDAIASGSASADCTPFIC
jgi:hypothetical protein